MTTRVDDGSDAGPHMNPFYRYVKSRYRSLGMHQRDLAALMGADSSTVSRYMSGDIAMPRDMFDQLCRALRLDGETHTDDRRRLWLASRVILCPREVQDYIAWLESDISVNAVCDDRLRKLGALVASLRDHHYQGVGNDGAWRPLFDNDQQSLAAHPEAPRVRVHRRIERDPEDDTRR